MCTPQLSIIVPVYNVERYIERCLLSCIHQNIDTSYYEIIIVNDGTQDRSIEIAQQITQDIPNVRYIFQSNQGLSHARNEGLKIARGKYIWFIDSDDWIEDNIFPVIFNYLSLDIEILALRTNIVYSNGKILRTFPRKIIPDQFIKGYQLYLQEYKYPYSGVQYYVYKKDFILEHGLKFKENIVHEDLLFTPQALSLAQRCIYCDKPVYNYFLREGSITSSKITIKRCMDLLAITDSLELFVNRHCKNVQQAKIIYDSIARIIGIFYHSYRKLVTQVDKKILIQEFWKRKYWLISIFKSYRFKYLVCYLFLSSIGRKV